MTLQSSGLIKLSQVGAEKGVAAPWSLVQMSTTNINQNSSSKPDGVAPHKLSEFYGYDQNAAPPVQGTLDAPTIAATWNFSLHRMDVAVTAGANNPSDTVYVISATGSGTRGSITGAGTYHDGVNPEDGTQSCYTAVATHSGWTTSASSNESCANRGNAA